MSNKNIDRRLVPYTEPMRMIAEDTAKTIAEVGRLALKHNEQWQSALQQLSRQLTELNLMNWSISVPHFYVSLPEIDTKILTDSLNVANEVASTVKSIDLFGEEALRRLISFTNDLNFVSQKVAADVVAAALAFQELTGSGVLRDLIKLVEEDGEAAEAFKAAGWPLPPSLPRSLRARVAGMHREGKTRYASQAILGYYQRNRGANLRSMVEGWENHPLYTSRMHIIRDAMETHIDGKYTLSVPALLPQVEGILNDFVRDNNLAARPGKITEVYQAVIGDLNSHTFASWAIANTLLYQLQSSTYTYTPFEQELRRSFRQRTTTRHTVLHGVAIGYDRPIHSLKLFLILDSIIALQPALYNAENQ